MPESPRPRRLQLPPPPRPQRSRLLRPRRLQPPSRPAKPSPTTAAAPTGASDFASEALAKAHCPADTVVWANLKSKIYHFSGNKDYGTTKEGAYMCEKEALGQGVRAAKNEKHP